jgi:hypothetical protein
MDATTDVHRSSSSTLQLASWRVEWFGRLAPGEDADRARRGAPKLLLEHGLAETLLEES